MISSKKFKNKTKKKIFFQEIINNNLKFYNITSKKYLKNIINNIIYNEKTHIVAIFKDYLILDDNGEFLKRFYKLKESFSRLPKFFLYYDTYSKIFPSYNAILEGKYIYRNILRKQRMIDLIEKMEIEQQNKLNKNISFDDNNKKEKDVFDTNVFNSILNITNQENIESLFGIKNKNIKEEDEKFFNDIEKIIINIEINEKHFENNKKIQNFFINNNILNNSLFKKKNHNNNSKIFNKSSINIFGNNKGNILNMNNKIKNNSNNDINKFTLIKNKILLDKSNNKINKNSNNNNNIEPNKNIQIKNTKIKCKANSQKNIFSRNFNINNIKKDKKFINTNDTRNFNLNYSIYKQNGFNYPSTYRNLSNFTNLQNSSIDNLKRKTPSSTKSINIKEKNPNNNNYLNNNNNANVIYIINKNPKFTTNLNFYNNINNYINVFPYKKTSTNHNNNNSNEIKLINTNNLKKYNEKFIDKFLEKKVIKKRNEKNKLIQNNSSTFEYFNHSKNLGYKDINLLKKISNNNEGSLSRNKKLKLNSSTMKINKNSTMKKFILDNYNNNINNNNLLNNHNSVFLKGIQIKNLSLLNVSQSKSDRIKKKL